MIFMKNRVVQHSLFWVGIFLFYTFSTDEVDQLGLYFKTAILKLPLLMMAAYVFNYYQVPIYVEQKRYVAFGCSMVLVVVVLTLFFRLFGYFYLDQYCSSGPYPYLSWVDFPLYMLTFHFPAMIMYFYKSNKKQDAKLNQIRFLEKEKLATELKYLKAQLNPHFLFNTLNDLYSYIVTKPDQAPAMVLQLSEILDYTLYKSQNDYVPLLEEIKTIENYIGLERIKFGDRLKLSFTKTIPHPYQPISPLILLSILENAFKHGVTGEIIKPEIKVEIVQQENILKFSVWNTKVSNQIDLNSSLNQNRIGVSNIKRQLDLIYPEIYELHIEETKRFYKLELTLNFK